MEQGWIHDGVTHISELCWFEHHDIQDLADLLTI